MYKRDFTVFFVPQVLADAKPLRQAGGSHELPFEYVAQEEEGKHHPLATESHGMENESESSQQRHNFHRHQTQEERTREEINEEKYKNFFDNEGGLKSGRSRGQRG